MTDSDLDIAALSTRAAALAREAGAFKTFLDALGHSPAALEAIGNVTLGRTATQELTRMRAQLPTLFDHSLKVTLISVSLARAVGMSSADQATVALAGLLHDIGEMRIDAAIVGASRPPSPEEWRQILAHPVIGKVVLEEGGDTAADVARAVAEHHERIDGSGYPAGKSKDELSLAGQVLAVGELVGGITERYGLDYLEVVLKAQSRKLHGGLVMHALEGVKVGGAASAPAAEAGLAVKYAALLEPLLARWNDMSLSTDTRARPGYRQLADAVADVRRALLSAGIAPDPKSVANFLQMVPEAEAEVTGLLRESLYELRLAVRARSAFTLPAELSFNTEDGTAIRDWLHEVEARMSPALVATAAPGEAASAA